MSMDRSVEREKGSAPGPKSGDIVSPIKDSHVTLDGRSDLSGQIYRQLRAAIVDGRLCVGDVLPKTRELAGGSTSPATRSPTTGSLPRASVCFPTKPGGGS